MQYVYISIRLRQFVGSEKNRKRVCGFPTMSKCMIELFFGYAYDMIRREAQIESDGSKAQTFLKRPQKFENHTPFRVKNFDPL